MAEELPDLKAKVQLDTSGLGDGLKKTEGDLDGFQKRNRKRNEESKQSNEGLKSSYQNLAATVASAYVLKEVGSFFAGTIKGAAEAEVVTRKTDAVIKSTGGTANVTSQQVAKLSEKVSELAGVDDEAVQSGANLLLTFKNIRNEAGKGNDVFNQTVQASADLSAAFGQDLKASAIQLGKALDNPIKGVTALQRVGVSFTEQQKEQIKVMTESGDVLGAQKIILAEVNSQVGGAAKASATEFGKLSVQLDNIKEDIGTTLLPAAKAAAGAISGMTNAFSSLPEPLKLGAIGAGALVVSLGPLTTIAANAKTVFGAAAGTIADFGRSLHSGQTAGDGLASSIGSRVNPILGPLGIGLGVAGLAVGLFAKRKAEATERVEKFSKALEADKGVIGDSTKELIKNALAQGSNLTTLNRLGITYDDVVKALDQYNDSLLGNRATMAAWSTSVKGTGKENEALEDRVRKSSNAFDQLQVKLSASTGETFYLRDALQGLAVGIDSSAEANAKKAKFMGEDVTATGAATEANKQLTGALKNEKSAYQELSEQVSKYVQKLSDELDPQLNLTRATSEYHASIDTLQESLKANGKTFDLHTEKGRKNADAVEGARSASQKLAEAQAAAGVVVSSQLGVTGAYTENLKGVRDQAGGAKIQVQGLIDTVHANPNLRVDMTIKHNLEETNKYLESVKSSLQAINQNGATVYFNPNTGAKARAHGGPVEAFRPYLVGEEGPELVVPRQSGTVIPADKTAKALSGSATYVFNNVSNAGEVMQVLKRYELLGV